MYKYRQEVQGSATRAETFLTQEIKAQKTQLASGGWRLWIIKGFK